MNRPRSEKRARLDVDGVLLLDKPLGWSSNDALTRAKYVLRARKAGHTGTLDPLATGLLPVCFGEATKFSQDLLEADKEYEAELCLGCVTTTGDAEGEVIDRREVAVSVAEIQAAAERFVGEIQQVPPMYSALKKAGRPLYEYARAGETVDRPPRTVFISELTVIAVALPHVRIKVVCSKGTYVRTLAEDIGHVLGCGAYLSALRRTAVGALRLENAVTLDALENADSEMTAQWLLPVDALVQSLPQLKLSMVLAERFLHGQRLARHQLSDEIGLPIGRVRVSTDAGGLLGVGLLDEHVLRPERILVRSSSLS